MGSKYWTLTGIGVVVTGLISVVIYSNKLRKHEANHLKPVSNQTRIEDVNHDSINDLVYTDGNGDVQIMYGHKDGNLYFPKDLAEKLDRETRESLDKVVR